MNADTNITHAYIQQKLYEHLLSNDKQFVVREACLGSPNFVILCQRADALTIAKSQCNFRVTIYEVKATRSDLLNDLRSGKWKGYTDFCHSISFVTLKGIAEKSDIPLEAGWIEYNSDDNKFVTRRKSPISNDITFNSHVMMGLMFAYNREERMRQAERDNRLQIQMQGFIDGLRQTGHGTAWARRKKQKSTGTNKEIRRAMCLETISAFDNACAYAVDDAKEYGAEHGYKLGYEDAKAGNEMRNYWNIMHNYDAKKHEYKY